MSRQSTPSGIDEPLPDTDGHRWMQIQDIGPPARMNHAMTYDEKRDSIVLFGGADQNTTRLGDTWEPRAGDIEQPTRPA